MATNQRSPKITQRKFLTIKRDIKKSVEAGNWNAGRIAKAHRVSDETVRAIKRTKTWPAWEIAKQVRRGQRNATYVLSAKAPEQRPLKLTQRVGDSESDKFAAKLREIKESPLTRAEFRAAINGLHEHLNLIARNAPSHVSKHETAKRRSIFARRG